MPSAPGGPLEVSIVTPVWGEQHIRRFLDIVLPSWLAPGNLPAFGSATPFLIVTQARDIPIFERAPSFRRAKAYTEISFVPLDDLIGPNGVPVTLTLAFARGIARLARPGCKRAFALLNADFVLADGSLRSLKAALDAGAKAVLAPSLRVVEEDMIGDLIRAVSDDVLVLPPRVLTAKALRALHPTVLASRVDQSVLRSANPNQLYWRPNADLLVGRAFCLFALAVVVERAPPPIGSYCDYGFIEELGVKTRPVIFGDSDRFLAVELGPLAQEQEFVEFAEPDPDYMASKLSVWTTAYHRAQAEEPIIYKAADPPADISAFVQQTGDFTRRMLSRAGPVQPRLEHPHWLGGVGAWRVAREYRGILDDPPELAATADLRRRASTAALGPVRQGARAILFGSPGGRLPQHPYWRLERALLQRLKALKIVAPSILGGAMTLQLLPDDVIAAAPGRLEDGDGAAVFLDLASTQRVEQLLAELGALPAGRLAIVAAQRTAEDDVGRLALIDLIAALDTDFEVLSVETFDLRDDRRAERAHGRLADARRGDGTLARLIAGSLAASARMFWRNVAIASRISPAPTGALTAVLLICRRRSPSINIEKGPSCHD